MLRLVHLVILPGVLLTTCAMWVSADPGRPVGKALAEGKQMYSNRPLGYIVPAQYYGTPMTPRFVAPPALPQTNTFVLESHPKLEPPQLTPAVVTGSVFPVATPQVAPQTSEQATTTTTVILREPPPETSVNDELDALNARLAKILLEKKQLDEALALVQNIKSETFKVRTLVNLAEYVSRDKNYQTEADRLYRLSLAGMEALDRNQPFRIDSGGVKVDVPQPVEQHPQPVQPQPVQPQPVDPKPVDPVVEQTTPVSSVVSGQESVPKPDEPPQDTPPAEKKPNGNGEKLQAPDPPKDFDGGNVTQPVLPPTRVNGSTPSRTDTTVSPPDPPPFVRPSATYDLDPEEEKPKPETTTKPVTQEEEKPATPPQETQRRPLRPPLAPQPDEN